MAVETEVATDDPREPADRLLRDLRTRPDGMSGREAQRRLTVYGPNELTRRNRRDWPRQLLRQFTHPLALLWLAAALAAVSGTIPLAVGHPGRDRAQRRSAFVQEQQAERAVDALAPIYRRTRPRSATACEPSCRHASWCPAM